MKLILLVVPILAVTALPQSHIREVTTSNSFRQPVVVPVASQRASLDDLLDGSAGCGGPNTECVPYHLCNNQVPMENLVDITLSDSGPCPGSLDVCCVSANKVTEPLFEPPKLTSQGCGFRSTEGIGFRISGGKDNEAQFGEFPWMTAILHKQLRQGQEINVYLCGGSLIHPRVVLTAAHCVAEKPNNVLKVRLGEWDTQTTSEPLPFQDRDVVEVNIHPGFKSQALANDVALLFLDSPVTIAENVKTVCLPEVSENFDHRRCFATGWGKDKFGVEGKYQVILKKIDLPIIPQDVCQDKLRTTRLSQYFELHNSFICAGGEKDKDTCKGDGGSPLVCPISPNSSRYYQAGIVAWGIGCGQSDVPGVYVKVSEFKEWIDKSLREKDINQISYTP